jgi:hypothetical protein
MTRARLSFPLVVSLVLLSSSVEAKPPSTFDPDKAASASRDIRRGKMQAYGESEPERDLLLGLITLLVASPFALRYYFETAKELDDAAEANNLRRGPGPAKEE